MTPASTPSVHEPPLGWFSRAEAWLDDKGKGAWIAAMVLGFIFFWPIGLALLAYMIWSKKMFGTCSHSRSRHRNGWSNRHMSKSSGNSAFDAYKADMLNRLEQEQVEFQAFLERLRAAKDKAEFDQFMADRGAAEARPDENARPEGAA